MAIPVKQTVLAVALINMLVDGEPVAAGEKVTLPLRDFRYLKNLGRVKEASLYTPPAQPVAAAKGSK